MSPRVISLLPSATEIVCALGCADQLVGISHECDFPLAIADRPQLTRSRIATDQGSLSIDVAVRGVIRDALSIYEVDAELLGQLAPEVIITQDLCEVCAVSLDDVRAAVARLAHREGLRIVSLSPTRLGDVLGDIGRVAAALGRDAEGAQVMAALADRIAAITARAAGAPSRPRVATIEWLDPVMIGGTWMPELVERAGGVALAATAGAPAPTLTPAELTALAAEVVVIKPCGFTIARSLAERALLDRLVRLAPGARVYLTDGNAYFNRPGPRLVESLEILAACVHPDRFADFLATHAAAIVRIG